MNGAVSCTHLGTLRFRVLEFFFDLFHLAWGLLCQQFNSWQVELNTACDGDATQLFYSNGGGGTFCSVCAANNIQHAIFAFKPHLQQYSIVLLLMLADWSHPPAPPSAPGCQPPAAGWGAAASRRCTCPWRWRLRTRRSAEVTLLRLWGTSHPGKGSREQRWWWESS